MYVLINININILKNKNKDYKKLKTCWWTDKGSWMKVRRMKVDNVMSEVTTLQSACELHGNGQWQHNVASVIVRGVISAVTHCATRAVVRVVATCGSVMLLRNDGKQHRRILFIYLFLFDNFKNLELLLLVYLRKRKKNEKEKKRESFETYSKIHHSPFGLALPSSSNLGFIGWQTSSLQ
jgi:hypothetical protein